MSWPPCPICGKTARRSIAGTVDASDYFRTQRYTIANHDTVTLDVLRCQRCGHGWSPIADTVDIEAWYASAPPDAAYLAESPGRSRAAAGVLRAIEKHRKPGMLLDVGCGPGLLLAEARKRGWSVAGIEPSAWAIDAAGQLGVAAAVTRATVDALSAAPPGSADAITLIDVIEHVRHPHALIRTCATILRNGGVLAIATPNIGSAVARMLGKRWYCIHPAHLHYFTHASLSQVLTRHGFRVVHAGQYLRWFSPAYVWSRIAKRPYPAGRLPPVPIPLFDALQVLAVRE